MKRLIITTLIQLTCFHLAGMENNQQLEKINKAKQAAGYLSKLPDDIVCYFFGYLDLDTKNIPLTCKYLYEMRKKILNEIKIDCIKEDAFKIRLLERRLIKFPKTLFDENLLRFTFYAEGEEQKFPSLHLTEKALKFNEVLEVLDTRDPSSSILKRLSEENPMFDYNRLSGLMSIIKIDVRAKKILEKKAAYNKIKKIAHIYVIDGLQEPIDLGTLMAVHLLKNILVNKEKRSKDSVTSNFKTIMEYLKKLSIHSYIFVSPCEKGVVVPHIRDFNGKSDLLSIFLQALPFDVFLKSKWDLFYTTDLHEPANHETIDTESIKIVKEFFKQKIEIASKENVQEEAPKVGSLFCKFPKLIKFNIELSILSPQSWENFCRTFIVYHEHYDTIYKKDRDLR